MDYPNIPPPIIAEPRALLKGGNKKRGTLTLGQMREDVVVLEISDAGATNGADNSYLRLTPKCIRDRS